MRWCRSWSRARPSPRWCASWPCSRNWWPAPRASGRCASSENRSDAGHAVRLRVETGPVGDSPARRNAIHAAGRLKAAEALLMADPFVQEMMRDFGARIVPGSIKAL